MQDDIDLSLEMSGGGGLINQDPNSTPTPNVC